MERPDDVPFEAVNQAGTFTRNQSYAEGLTRRQARRRLASGRWKVVAGDALTHGSTPIGPWQLAFAVLLTWPGAVISHELAGALHGFPIQPPTIGTAIVPVHRSLQARGLRAHRVPLPPADIARLGGLPVTTPRRTALDLLRRLPWDDARSLWAWLVTRQICSVAELDAELGRPGRRAGSVQLRRLSRSTRTGALSAAEDRLHILLRRAGITGWRANAPVLVAGRTIAVVDVLFAAQRLVIEVDGFSTHAGPDRFQQDRTRQNRLVATGYTVLRYTWQDLTERPDQVITGIRAAIDRLSVAK